MAFTTVSSHLPPLGAASSACPRCTAVIDASHPCETEQVPGRHAKSDEPRPASRLHRRQCPLPACRCPTACSSAPPSWACLPLPDRLPPCHALVPCRPRSRHDGHAARHSGGRHFPGPHIHRSASRRRPACPDPAWAVRRRAQRSLPRNHGSQRRRQGGCAGDAGLGAGGAAAGPGERIAWVAHMRMVAHRVAVVPSCPFPCVPLSASPPPPADHAAGCAGRAHLHGHRRGRGAGQRAAAPPEGLPPHQVQTLRGRWGVVVVAPGGRRPACGSPRRPLLHPGRCSGPAAPAAPH